MTHSLADEAVVIEESRRNAAARLHEAEEEGRVDIAGHTFAYRDALFRHLFYARAERMPAPVGKIDCPANRLSRSEIEMLKCVAIKLWGDHARAHGVDVRMITREQHELVSRAHERKSAAQQPLSLAQVRRDLDRLLPGQTTHPANDRRMHTPRRR